MLNITHTEEICKSTFNKPKQKTETKKETIKMRKKERKKERKKRSKEKREKQRNKINNKQTKGNKERRELVGKLQAKFSCETRSDV